MKCYSYIRFSSKIQAHGRSYDRQLEAARQFASEKKWELDESLCMYDAALSGFHAQHKSKGELGAFLKAVEEGKIPVPSALIVENLDRLSREAIPDALADFLNIIRSGITIVTLTDNHIYDYESIKKNQNELLISISIMTRSHDESFRKQYNRTDAWNKAREQARNGNKYKGRCVAWLKLNHKTGKFEKIEERVEIVQRIYSLYLSGYGLFNICKVLNGEGIPTFQKRTKGWGTSTIRRILTTRSVLGEIQFNKTIKIENGQRIMVPDGEPIEDYYPPIIDEETFYKAQHRKILRYRAFGKIGEMNNLFSGLVKCGYCNATMQYSVRGRNKIKYLTCREAKKGSCDVDIVMSFRYQDLEDIFLQSCERLNLNDIIDDTNEHKQKIDNTKSKIITVSRKIEESKQKIDNYTESIANTEMKDTIGHFVGLIDSEKKLQSKLTEENKKIKQKLSIIEGLYKNTKNSLNNLNAVIEKMSSTNNDERIDIRRKLQKAILELVERIDLYPYGYGYKGIWNNLENLSEENVKKFTSRNMKKFRSAIVYFRAGGHLQFSHDPDTEGLKFVFEKDKENRFTEKTLNEFESNLMIEMDNHYLTNKEQENILKWMRASHGANSQTKKTH